MNIAIIKTITASAAVLYFARADESKQAVMKALVSGHEMSIEMMKEEKKMAGLPVSHLMDDIRYFTDAAESLAQSGVLCEQGLGYFDTMNIIERGLFGGALSYQHSRTKAHVLALLDELKSRLN